MTIDFYDGSNNDALFNVLGRGFYAQEVIQTALGTTIPAEIEDILTTFANIASPSVLLRDTLGDIPGAANAENFSLSQTGTVQTALESLLVQWVDEDATLNPKTLTDALQELIDQMIANSESVNASTVAVSLTAGGSNTGNGTIVLSTKGGDGLVRENAYAETLAVTAGNAASLTVTGQSSVSLLDTTWPQGSDGRGILPVTSAASSLLANGDMEDEDDVPNRPDDWIVSVGTIGTTILMTDVEVQTVIISGTPTGGHYLLHWTSPNGDALTTRELAYNASGSVVQAELRKFPGLELITVATTGTSPNFTHTITFTGKGGDLNQLTSTTANLTGGTPAIAHATSSAGTAQVYAGGKSLILDSNGSTLDTLNQRLENLSPETAYAVSGQFLADVVPAAGVITIDLVDGIGGTVIQDKQGVNNAFSFNGADLTTSWQHLSDLVSGEVVFRTPSVLPEVVYFRLRISTAVSSGTSVFVDDLALAQMAELYAGGPLAKAFSGSVPFDVNDTWTITVTNDRAGELQEWFNRNFDMAGKGLLLPSDTGGSETIPDTVIG